MGCGPQFVLFVLKGCVEAWGAYLTPITDDV